jgi:GNAT superfamily N-acetyltransferase
LGLASVEEVPGTVEGARAVAIRPARPADLETLLTIQRGAAVSAFAHVFPQDRYPFPSDDIREVWREALADPDVEVYVAEVDGEPAGSVSVGGDFLRTLYVLPSRQSSGTGSALHDVALARLRDRGVACAKLWTLEENWPARRFYERRGWTLTDETRVVPFPPNPIDVQYEKTLLGDLPSVKRER